MSEHVGQGYTHQELLAILLDPHLPKSEREHCLVREIAALRDEVARVVRARKEDRELIDTHWLRQMALNRVLAKAKAEVARLKQQVDKAGRLVAAIDLVHADPAYLGVWTMAQMHFGPYRGATFTAELAELKAALAPEAATEGRAGK